MKLANHMKSLSVKNIFKFSEEQKTSLTALKLSEEEQEYLATVLTDFTEDDDPAKIISFDDAAIDAMIISYHSGDIKNLPAQPAFIDMSTSNAFKLGILQHLRLVSGGFFGCVMAPNNVSQYENITARLRDIELDPYVQALGDYVGCTLAVTAIVEWNGNVSSGYRIAPTTPYRQIFA